MRSKREAQEKMRELLKQQITEWGVGGSSLEAPQSESPPLTPQAAAQQTSKRQAAASATATYSAPKPPTDDFCLLPGGSTPLSPPTRLSKIQQIYKDLYHVEQAAYWTGLYLPRLNMNAELATEKNRLRSELTTLMSDLKR